MDFLNSELITSALTQIIDQSMELQPAFFGLIALLLSILVAKLLISKFTR